MSQLTAAAPADGFGNGPTQRTLFGHPLGLYTLFFTEMWERFSFYGMKTLLVLYMINHFFWSQEDASHLLGTYAFLAYGLPVIGGFIADRYIGAKRAVIYGAILLSIGHFLMAFESMFFFYSALGFIVAGVGLLKPNVSTQVGALYKPGDPRRDGAFTVFYMGINLGALIGPFICDWLRVNYGWHYGFGAAGVGMVFGLIVYVIGQRYLVEFKQDVGDSEPGKNTKLTEVHPPHVVRDRIIVLLIVFAFVILFWTAFEQSPNVMLVWADKHTNLQLLSAEAPPVTLEELSVPTTKPAGVSLWQGVKDWFSEPGITSGQSQSFNPFFIIVVAPIFAFFWVWLEKRKMQPSTPTKMVMGLGLVALAFGVMWPAAQRENRPSTAALAERPEAIQVDKHGTVFTIEKDDDGAEDRIYYGATRLKYNADKRELLMSGVLTDLDRLRLLAATAPPELVDEFEMFVKRTSKRPSHEDYVTQLRLVETVKALVENSDRLAGLAKTDTDQCYREITLIVEQATVNAEAKAAEGWTISTVLETAPAGIARGELTEGEGKNKKTILKWDPDTNTLTAFGEIKERTRIAFLAAAGQGEFKTAVDMIYLDSARFRVSIWWLIAFFMVLTMGELCISPVGLSLVTKLSPAKSVGFMMGGWFLATAVAEYTAQVFGAWWGKMPPGTFFVIFVVMCVGGALFMALLIKPMKRMMHGVH